MSMQASSIRSALGRAATAARAAEDDLNAADGKLGDGDTGLMLRRLFETLGAAAPADEDDVGLLFRALARAGASATGSSLGTLVTVAMLTAAKETAGRREVPGPELGSLLGKVRDAMMARGGASLGDKTIDDMLDAVAQAVDGRDDPALMLVRAQEAGRRTLDACRDRPSRLGRARMFGEKSIGLDDPGMLALQRLLEGLGKP
jgi:hypothetical protein